MGKTTLSHHTTNFGTYCLSMTAVCCAAIVSVYHRKDERKYRCCYMMVIDPVHTRMKALSRSYVWWPGIDQEIEEKVKACNSCQRTRHNPAPAPLHPWEFPNQPWERLHADYAGPFEGKMFLIVIDAYSKWLEVKPVTAANSSVTIEHLRNMFATHGLPKTLVTDNRTQFMSIEFESFMKKNGIRHIRWSPYHPSSNGLAERAVQCSRNV